MYVLAAFFPVGVSFPPFCYTTYVLCRDFLSGRLASQEVLFPFGGTSPILALAPGLKYGIPGGLYPRGTLCETCTKTVRWRMVRGRSGAGDVSGYETFRNFYPRFGLLSPCLNSIKNQCFHLISREVEPVTTDFPLLRKPGNRGCDLVLRVHKCRPGLVCGVVLPGFPVLLPFRPFH